jgi:hypothetical protein
MDGKSERSLRRSVLNQEPMLFAFEIIFSKITSKKISKFFLTDHGLYSFQEFPNRYCKILFK